MISTGLIGRGYWGSIIEQKLDLISNKIFVQTSKNYDPSLFDKVSWIFIATPLDSHYKIAKDCLNRGKNVFLEKPFCSTLAESKDLVDLAKSKGAFLYIDNVFLKRSEFLNIKKSNFKNIKFVWQKSGPYNDSLVNDLLYHDFYTLISLAGHQSVTEVDFQTHTKNSLTLKILFGNVNVEFTYNRLPNLKNTKIIAIDGDETIFRNSQEDPLKKIILDCLEETADFESNQKINLLTMELMSIIECKMKSLIG
jgi:predicted dehydrogenase